MDLQIKIENRRFIVDLLIKETTFPLVVRKPYKSSHLPSSMFYSAIGAEPLRIVKPNNNANLFYSSVKPLIFGMIKQGAHSDKLSNVSKKLFKRQQILLPR